MSNFILFNLDVPTPRRVTIASSPVRDANTTRDITSYAELTHDDIARQTQRLNQMR